MVIHVQGQAAQNAYQAHATYRQTCAPALLMALLAPAQTNAQRERARLVLAAPLKLVSHQVVQHVSLPTCARVTFALADFA